MVENQGRINWAAPGDKGRLDAQRKGILGDIKLNGKILENWKMWSLSFNETMISAITGQKDWWTSNCQNPILPGLFKASLNVDEPKVRLSKALVVLNRWRHGAITDFKIKDTFIQLPEWEKGIIFVNGFNIGRYMNKKPQSSYYVPAPLLKKGKNEILIFEERKRGPRILSTDKHLIGQK